MRKKLIAGNWKMYVSYRGALALLREIRHGFDRQRSPNPPDVVVFPSFVHLTLAEQCLAESPIKWGAQNLYIGEAGAFTGEISGPMLTDYGCQYVLVGHSERRLLFFEDLPLVAAKFKAAIQCGLTPILCLGETVAQREKQLTERVISEQLESVIESTGIDVFHQAVIAYEPVWAIGTGVTATPEQAQAVHTYIRKQLARHSLDVANTIRILYGGSVKADNAKALLAMPDIDGGLVGGASLDADSFLTICKVSGEG